MDYLNEFLTKVIPINILELLAAIAGSYFLRNKPNTSKVNKYFVYFLWYTFINEIIGSYAPIAYFTKYEYFSFVKDTVFFNNVWLYNIFSILSYTFFAFYFISFLQNKKSKQILNGFVLSYLVASIFILIYSGVFFETYSLFSIMAGSFLLMFSIILFYFNLLKNDYILDLKKYLPIYISIGVLVFNLCITPLFIFSHYFNQENNDYVLIRTNVLLIANVFLYSSFIIGFLICARKRKKPLLSY